MDPYFKVTKNELDQYIQYFSQQDVHYILTNEAPNQGTFKHYQYTKELEDFVAWVTAKQLLKSNYMILLEQKNIHMALGPTLKCDIMEADLETLLAILTYCIRYERFCTGLWLICAKEGYFIAILNRLLQLSETHVGG